MSFLIRARAALAHAIAPRRGKSSRSYAAAQLGRLYQDWITGQTSADAEIRSSYRRVIDRSRSLERDNDYMRGFLGDCEDNIVGSIRHDLTVDAGEYKSAGRNGGEPVWLQDKLANRLITEAWTEWGRLGSCTLCGRHSWRDVKNLAARAVPRDGNFLARRILGAAARNRFGFALQLWDIDHLDLERHGSLPDGGEIRFGIERDADQRVTAYWLRARHPGDMTGGVGTYASRRFPADEIYHVFVSERPEQSIGMPWVVSAITRLRQLGAFEEAAVIAARLGAAKSGFFKKTGDGVGSWTGESDASGQAIMDATPGTFTELPTGWDIANWAPEYPNIDTAVFRKAMLMGVATGLRQSYISLGNDLEAVNYSSARVGIYDERETWKSYQVFFDEHFRERVFADWLEAAIIAGAVNLPLEKFTKFNRPIFKARRWAYIDPSKEMSALREALDLRVTSRRSHIEEQGGDIADTFHDIAADAALAEDLGLSLPDTSRPTASPSPADSIDAAAQAAAATAKP